MCVWEVVCACGKASQSVHVHLMGVVSQLQQTLRILWLTGLLPTIVSTNYLRDAEYYIMETLTIAVC